MMKMDIINSILNIAMQNKLINEQMLRTHLYSSNEEESVRIRCWNIPMPSLAHSLRIGDMRTFLHTLAAIILAPKNNVETVMAVCNTLGYYYYQMVAFIEGGRYIHLIPKCSPLRTEMWHSFNSIPVHNLLMAHGIFNNSYREIKDAYMGKFKSHPSCEEISKSERSMYYSYMLYTPIIHQGIRVGAQIIHQRYMQRMKDRRNTMILHMTILQPIIHIIRSYL